MRTRHSYHLYPFPPVTRPEFDNYYERLEAFSIPKESLFKALVSDILFRGLPAAEADAAAHIFLHSKGDGTSPGASEPFRKTFLNMMNPSQTDEVERPYLEAVSINTAQGMEKLRKLEDISSDLTSEEQKLVVSMITAAHQIEHTTASRKWQSATLNRTKENSAPTVPGFGN